MQYLTASLDDVEYGIEILQVKEIRSYVPPTTIVGYKEYVRGVIDLRGQIIPIIDLKKKFNPGTSSTGEIVIIMTIKEETCGIIMDSVADVIEISKDNIKPLETGVGAHEFQVGIYGEGSRNIVIVNSDKFL